MHRESRYDWRQYCRACRHGHCQGHASRHFNSQSLISIRDHPSRKNPYSARMRCSSASRAMDDSSPTARENRPAHRPPAPPAVAFDNHAYQPDEQQDGGPARQNDANHNLTQQNESFGANGDVKSDNDTNNDRKEPYEAVNLELINLAPKNGSAAKEAAPKKEVEVDMNSSNPYDEYFVPVNEHKKYIRGEKLYVTADKRNKGGNRRPLCWTVGILLLLGAILIAVLAATGVIFTSTATPVNQYNSSLSTARALGGLSGALEHGEHGEHGHEQVSEHSAPETSTDGALDYTMADVPDDSLYVPRTVEGELKIDNEDFKPELSDEFSEPHREFTGTLARALARALFPPDGRRADSDVRVSILNLNPGSVVVTYRIHWIPKSNVQNATDSISSENLNTKLSDYLQSNHRMLNIYHVSEDGLKARRVLDRCQNDMNGCESGCEFDNVMLDFKCTCPSNKVPDMKNPKKCVYPMDNSLYAHLPITSEKTNEGDYRVLNISEENSQPSISPQDKAETDVVIDSSDIFDWMNSQTPKTEQTTENMLDIKNSHIFGNPKDDLLVDPISNINLEDSSEEPSATHRSILMHEPPAEPAAEPEPEPSAEPNPSPKPEPAAEPEPEPAAEPEPEPAAEPEPEPAAEPEPGPAAVPEPEPTHSSNDDIDEHVTSLAKSVFPVKENLVPRPVQTSTKVESEPKPEPEPTIQLQPEPTSQPEPEPTSEPQQQQSEPRPTIQPQPEPINEPQSVLQPQSKPTSELQGEPDNKAKVTINTYNSKSSDELQSVIQKSISEEIINASTESVLMPYPESSSKTPFVEDLNNESSRMSKTNHVQQLDESISHDEKNHVTSSAIVQINNNFTTAIKSIEPVDSSKEIAFSSSENTTDEANYREYMGEEYEVEDVVTEASKNKGIRENNYIPNENFFSNVKEEITQPTLAEEVNEDTTEIDLTTHTNSQSDVNNDSTEPPVRLLEQQQNRFTSTSGEENEDSKNESLTMKEKLEGKEYSTDIINKSTNSSETMSVEDLNERSKKTISADSKEITFDAIQEITSTLTVNPENTTISETTEIENESTTSRTIINSEMPDPNPKLVNLLDESSTTEHSNLDWLSSVIDQENETIESSTHLIMLESNEDSTDKPEDSYDPAKANDDHSEKKESDEDTESNEDDNGTDSDYLSNAALEGQDVPQYGLLTDYDSASYRDKRLQTTSMKTETTSEPTKPNITDKMLADYIYNSANRSRESSESEELELNASNAMAEEQEMNMQLDNSGKEPAPVWEHDEIEPEQVFYNEGANSTESETVAENKTTANQHNNIIPLPVAPFSNYSQSNNLNVTVYEVPGNTTKTLKVESITHSADVEEHESEMNPFLPEIDNNKYLVKKLQEGHDLDPTNVNEKQNEHSDELPIVESQMTKHKTQVQNVTDTSLKSDEDITDTTEVAVTTHSVGPNLDERLKEHKIEDSTDSSDELDKMLEEREQLISAKPAVGNSKITRDGSSKLVSSSFIDDISDLLSSKEGSGSDEAMMVSTVSDSDVNFLDMLSTTTQPFSQSNGLLETELKTNAPVEDQHFSEAHFSANEDGILSVLPIKPAKKSDKKPTNDYFQKKNEKNAKLQENNVNDISDYSDRNQRTLDVTNYQSE